MDNNYQSINSFYFNGKYRSVPGREAKPQVTKDEFVHQLALLRQERELTLKKAKAAVLIQKHYRSHLARVRLHSRLRRSFDDNDQYLNKGSANAASDARMQLLLGQLRMLVIIYSPKLDDERILILSQHLLLERASFLSMINVDDRVRHLINRFCLRCIEHIAHVASSTNVRLIFAPVLRILEVYGMRDVKSTLLCARSGYFTAVRSLFVNRVYLPSDTDSFDVSSTGDRLPNQMAQSLFDAFILPVNLVSSMKDKDQFMRPIILEMVIQLLSLPADRDLSISTSRHLACHLIPALARLIADGKSRLSLQDVLTSLLSEEWRLSTAISTAGKSMVHASIVRFSSKLDSLCETSPLAAYLILELTLSSKIELLSWSDKATVLHCLSASLQSLVQKNEDATAATTSSENDDDFDVGEAIEIDRPPPIFGSREYFVERVVAMLHRPQFTSILTDVSGDDCHDVFLPYVARIIANISFAVTRCNSSADDRLKSTMAFSLHYRRRLLRTLWELIISPVSNDLNRDKSAGGGRPKSILDRLQQDTKLSDLERTEYLSLSYFFCQTLTNILYTVEDDEFYSDEQCRLPSSLMPFSNVELTRISEKVRDVVINLIQMAYPDSRNAATINVASDWSDLLELTMRLLSLLYERSIRTGFCHQDLWWKHNRPLHLDRSIKQSFRAIRQQPRWQHSRAFGFVYYMTHEDVVESGGLGPSSQDLRYVTILKRVPFLVPFLQRVQVLREIIMLDRLEQGRERDHFGLHADDISIRVRRNYMYEDAFSELSRQNAPNLKKNIRVSMINWAEMNEAGIDGGGIFREFISELLHDGFKPDRGFFKTTPRANLIYPNPLASDLYPDTIHSHFNFLGRILGKLIYENQLVELRFAPFFLAKLLQRRSPVVDIHYLKWLDEDFYTNLLTVKRITDRAEMEALELDFSVLVETLGSLQKVELKPNGANIRVTVENKIEYVHLVADYYLNKRIEKLTAIFRDGLREVVDLDWLSMFDHRELQILISGVDRDLDLSDMRSNCSYTPVGITANNETVGRFWRVVADFDSDQKRRLLKFITGCSRPPLGGFKDLYPPLAIQVVPGGDRLPTAATCMNLLKLPQFDTDELLKERLLYAISSGAGFELS